MLGWNRYFGGEGSALGNSIKNKCGKDRPMKHPSRTIGRGKKWKNNNIIIIILFIIKIENNTEYNNKIK